jgi:hypothetical protein
MSISRCDFQVPPSGIGSIWIVVGVRGAYSRSTVSGIKTALKGVPTKLILSKWVALAQRRLSAPLIAQESTMLKLIPITKPGVPGFSYALARTDADETAV